MKISPHVNIYKFPLTAISSITNRISGLYLTGAFIGGGILLGSGQKDFAVKKYNNLENYQKKLLNYSLIVPSTYHTLGGIRHFLWDRKPSLINNKFAYRSSAAIFGLSLTLPFFIEKMINK